MLLLLERDVAHFRSKTWPRKHLKMFPWPTVFSLFNSGLFVEDKVKPKSRLNLLRFARLKLENAQLGNFSWSSFLHLQTRDSSGQSNLLTLNKWRQAGPTFIHLYLYLLKERHFLTSIRMELILLLQKATRTTSAAKIEALLELDEQRQKVRTRRVLLFRFKPKLSSRRANR